MSETFESSRAPEPVGAFPHAKRVGNLLFLSGIGPRVRGSKEIPGVTLDAAGNIESYDIEKQCRAVFENVRLVLEDAGARYSSNSILCPPGAFTTASFSSAPFTPVISSAISPV